MLQSCLRRYWLTGVATAVAAATLAYVVAGDSIDKISSNNKNSQKNEKAKNKLSGLINEGNTCFINAILQALASSPLFVMWIDSVINMPLIDNRPLRTSVSLHSTVTVVNNQNADIQCHPYNTRQLIVSLEKHGWILKSDEQDAHEFFNLLLTTVDEEVNSNKKEIGLEVSVFPNNFHSNITSSPFRGFLANQLCCLTCGHKASVRYDAFECLSIPLPKLDIKNAFNLLTVESLLKTFLAAETVGEVQCDNCSSKHEGKASKSVFVKQLSLGKLPQCLCLHIQRCDWTTGQLTKRHDLVKFGEELDVSQFVYTRRLTGNYSAINYRLRAVVEHLGVADSGHFVTFRQNALDGRVKWFYTSDALVKSASINEVLKSSPYMLFYERCT